MKNVNDLSNIKGKVAIVTGSATGIGQAIAVGLAEAGVDIAGVYCTTSYEETKALVEAAGQKFFSKHADVSKPKEVSTIIPAALKEYGKFDILINDAGIESHNPIGDTYSEEEYQRCLQINLNQVVALTAEAGNYFKKTGNGGRILNVSSIAGYLGMRSGMSPYVITKHAIRGVTRSFGLELAPYGVTVNAIAPGPIYSRMTTEPPMKKLMMDRVVAAKCSVGRWGFPEDFKGIANMLCSDAGGFITGQTILVDGGYTLT
ncbi:SDR family NAD(P)-dependent oxidoreductase [Clostridium sp.]|uniref:SDR family NAD(P)-dependent oxidoreductase n=1 Tax=Clostridium sp. TaxID=1506 RepID=UPI003D6D90DE